jgi:subtilisin family serine protease
VAAAGNDSAPEGAPEAPNFPAIWDRLLLGVAASNISGELSCFSNYGEILAPGGDGGVAPPQCEQTIHLCTGQPDCKYGLISLSLLSPSGFIYWNGSSFAAPLASGAAARLFGVTAPAARGAAAAGPKQVVERVEAEILDRAETHGNVLIVP